jgi:hypothetical protein
MKQARWSMACLALALTGIMTLAVPVFAQQGRGGGPQGQGNQGCTGGGPGSGSGAGTCPAYQQGNPNRPYDNGNNTQPGPRGRRGMRGGGRGNQPANQTPSPAVNQ